MNQGSYPNMNFDYTPHFCECSKCGRRILVEQVLFGVPHTLGISASCAECLAKHGIDEEFKKERPEIANEIEEWIHSSPTTTKEET